MTCSFRFTSTSSAWQVMAGTHRHTSTQLAEGVWIIHLPCLYALDRKKERRERKRDGGGENQKWQWCKNVFQIHNTFSGDNHPSTALRRALLSLWSLKYLRVHVTPECLYSLFCVAIPADFTKCVPIWRSTAGWRNRFQHLSIAATPIGSQFKELFPSQMGDSGKRKCILAHAYTHTHTQMCFIWFRRILDFFP